ncbi:MAG: HAD family hydrolase [Holosporaceae bacterium]|nr:MAG: HAD family hydrolase [Holosporaceae bacterium]
MSCPEILDPNVCLTPEVILFDWDGVLVDTKDLIQEAYLATFAALDQEPIEIDTVHQLPGTSLRDYFPQILGKKLKKQKKFFISMYTKNHISSLKSMPHAKDLLETIYAHKIPMAVVSNKEAIFCVRKQNT